jgi:hypothetical protein
MVCKPALQNASTTLRACIVRAMEKPVPIKKLLRDLNEDELRATIRSADEQLARVAAGGVAWKTARNLRESCNSELYRRDPKRRAAS